MASNTKIEWPKNLVLTGGLSFPIKSEDEIKLLQEWRAEKKLKKPKYADKIGVTLLLKEPQLEKIVKHLEDVYLPFVDVLYKNTDGEKGVEPEVVAALLKQVKARDWSDKNLPIRELTAKDIENNGGDECPYIAKVKINGPYESSFKVAAKIVREGQVSEIVEVNEIEDYGFDVPDNYLDTEKLWWGAGATIQVSLRFNAFDTANTGVSAYGNKLYLLPHLGLPTFGGGSSDADVVDEGDDWDE